MKKRAKAASASSSTHALSERDSDQTTRLDYTDTKLQVSKYKVVSSGESVDIYEYEVPIARGIKKQRAQNRAAIYNRNSEYQTKSITRAKNKIRRLILSNFKTNDKFITLTFNDENVFDINKLEVCLKYYKKFVRKLKNIYPAIKYIAVPEFQKRGAVHYHIICNLPHLDKDKIQSLWGHGFIKIKAIFDSQSAAIYLTKYLSKRFDYKKKLHHRLYYSSKNLKQPTVIYGEAALLVATYFRINYPEPSYSSSYETAHNGIATFTQYNRKYNAE